MLRSIIAVVIGIVAASLVVFCAEMGGHRLFPTPDVAGHACREVETYSVKEAASACIAATPMNAKVAVVVGWFLGAFVGGVAALLIGGKWAPLAWIVAGVIFLLSVSNFLMFPHPVWMIAGSVFAALLAGFGATAIMGAKFTRPAKAR